MGEEQHHALSSLCSRVRRLSRSTAFASRRRCLGITGHRILLALGGSSRPQVLRGMYHQTFQKQGLAQPGVCNPHLFNKVTSTKNVVQCSDGVTNVKYCAAPLYTVTVTQKTLGENAVEVLAEASVASMFVHQIVTSPGDHCLEITIPGGAGSPFWKANSWKYSAPDRPEWKTGACDHTKWDEVDST